MSCFWTPVCTLGVKIFTPTLTFRLKSKYFLGKQRSIWGNCTAQIFFLVFDADVTAIFFCDLDSMTADLLWRMLSICFISVWNRTKKIQRMQIVWTSVCEESIKNDCFLQCPHGNLITFWINEWSSTVSLVTITDVSLGKQEMPCPDTFVLLPPTPSQQFTSMKSS